MGKVIFFTFSFSFLFLVNTYGNKDGIKVWGFKKIGYIMVLDIM